MLFFFSLLLSGTFASLTISSAKQLLNAYNEFLSQADVYARASAALEYPNSFLLDQKRETFQSFLHDTMGLDPSSFQITAEKDLLNIYGVNVYNLTNDQIAQYIQMADTYLQNSLQRMTEELENIGKFPKNTLQIPNFHKIDRKKRYKQPSKPFSFDTATAPDLYHYVDDSKADGDYTLKSADFCDIEENNLGGYESTTYNGTRKTDGTKWFIKGGGNESFKNDLCVTHIETSASKIYRLLSERILPMGIVQMKLPSKMHKNGTLVSIQPFLKDISSTVSYMQSTNAHVPTWDDYASDEERGLVLSSYIADLWIGNFDAHEKNCLITTDGRFIPIDFGQAFSLHTGSSPISQFKSHIMNANFAVAKLILIANKQRSLVIPPSAYLAMRKMILRIQSLDDKKIRQIITAIPDHCAQKFQKTWTEIANNVITMKASLMTAWEDVLPQYQPGFQWPLDQAENITINRCKKFSWPLPICIKKPNDSSKISGQWHAQMRAKRDISESFWMPQESSLVHRYHLLLCDKRVFDTEQDCWLHYEGLSADIATNM